MGWTYTHKEKGVSIKSFFEKEFNFTKEDGSYGKVLECKSNISEAYIAYETGNAESSEVIAIVCLLGRSKGYHNFGYKDMDETMGPHRSNAPKAILDLLTPIDSEWANQWRSRCYANLELLKIRTKLVNGDVVVFENPFSFGRYGEASKFTCTDSKRLYFYAHEIGIEVKLRKSSFTNNKHTITKQK